MAVGGYRGQANELTLEVSQRLAAAEEWASKGYELSFGQTVVAGSKPVAASETKPVDGIVTVGRWNAGVQGSGREILLSRTQGGIVSYTLDGREFVLRRPTLTTFRALTDNDRGAGHGYDRAQWVGAGRYAKCVNNTIEQVNDDTLKAVYEYELATPQRTHVTITYVADTTGKLHLSVDYPAKLRKPRPFRLSVWNGRCRSNTPTCASTAPDPTKPTPTASMPSWAFGTPTLTTIMRRTSCRRKPATMRMCVGLRSRMMPVMACV